MARIPTLREDDPATPPAARAFLQQVGRPHTDGGLGEVFDSIRLFANHPQQATAFLAFVRSVRQQNQLTASLTELAWTTASVVNGCYY